jgi:PAS domain S-box-containing protein
VVKPGTDQLDLNSASGPTSNDALQGRVTRQPEVSSDDASSGLRTLLSIRDRSEVEQAYVEQSGAPAVPLASLDFALLRGALEEIPFGVATTRSGEILYANAALERIYGAVPGGFEHKHVAVLFDHETFVRISNMLDEKRVFDGRIKAYGVDGRLVDAEVHAEWYSSEALGIGGFLVFRDVSLELGALGRLVDQLGGALFRLRTADGSLEYVSPSVAKLTGIEPATCVEHPVLLTNLVSAEERERVLFLFKRVAAGEIASATAQVSLRRPDGRIRVLHIRATGRRDTAGTVRHIDGVVTDAAREGEGSTFALEPAPSSYMRAPPRRRDGANLAPAVMELSQELLREASQHLHSLGRAIGIAQLELSAATETAPQLGALSDRLDVMARAFAAATSINRRVRHALSSGGASAPLGDVLDGVRATLAPVIGDGVIAVEASDAATMLLDHRVDELALALTHLALRAFRFAGSGGLRLGARRIAPLPPDPRLRSRIAVAPQETQDTLITLLGTAPPDSAVHGDSLSADFQTVPRRDENDQAFAAVKSILAAVGGTIELDDVTFDEAITTVRLRG